MNHGAHSVLIVSENTGESERSRNGDEKLSGCKNNGERFRNKKSCNHHGLHLNRGGAAVDGCEEPKKERIKLRRKEKEKNSGEEMRICLREWEKEMRICL